MSERYISKEPFAYLFPGVDYRPVFLTECFELVYHGGGGFSWSEVWNMPVIHRRFNLKKINEYLGKVEAIRQQQNNIVTENTDMSKFKIPDHVKGAIEKNPQPTFVSKIKTKK